MNTLKTDLSKYDNSWYNPGGSGIKKIFWYFINLAFFKSSFPFYGTKRFLLRAFGAKVGKEVVIKPHVSIKYPWKLELGNYVWIGENVWIDNLELITIKDNACVSQGAMLLCGNHNYKKSSFDLMVGKICIEEGAWVGAKSVVCPGVTLHSHALLTVGSVAIQSLDAYGIYQGNPAVKVRERVIKK